MCDLPSSISTKSPTTADILRWTLTSEATASCFIKDVHNMDDKGLKDPDFFWLGRVPCRKVRVVGILVGVQVEEKRTIYTLDDSTGVIECFFRHPTTKPSPKKPASRSVATASTSLPFRRSSDQANANPPPKPIACVGTSVCVVGRVMKRFETRKIYIDEIVRCASMNAELQHWAAVLELHEAHYFPSHPIPFLVPSPLRNAYSPTKQNATQQTSFSPLKDKRKRPATVLESESEGARPSSPISVASSTTQTSPARSSASSMHPSSPPRLRHPSRLHSKDLNANTFRIYLKHYLDRSYTMAPSSPPSSRSPSPTPVSRKGKGRATLSMLEGDQVTPTKRPRYTGDRPLQPMNGDTTPRPSQVRKQVVQLLQERTPRVNHESREIPDSSSGDAPLYGITLSHLRRVPELAELARRVVNTEGRRRAREERKRAEAGKTPVAGTSTAVQKTGKTAEPARLKVKRLFKFAIRQLYEEGAIVLWDGPTLPLPSDDSMAGPSASALWRLNVSTSTALTSNSSRASASGWGEDPDEELSDPPRNEEAYISLGPAYLLVTLERVIPEMIAHSGAQRARETRHRSRPALAMLQGPPPGPTAGELLKWLQRDERWARVGEWAVREALEMGKAQGRLWCVGKDRWEVCG